MSASKQKEKRRFVRAAGSISPIPTNSRRPSRSSSERRSTKHSPPRRPHSKTSRVSDHGAAEGTPARLTRAEIEAAYQTHAHSVVRRAESLLGSPPEAREVLQEVFMSLLER